MRAPKALLALVIAMGVLIVAGVAVIGVTIAHRVANRTADNAARSEPAPAPALGSVRLDEPAGTRIAQVAAVAGQVALLLQGGGPDRLVLLDARTGQPRGRVALAR